MKYAYRKLRLQLLQLKYLKAGDNFNEYRYNEQKEVMTTLIKHPIKYLFNTKPIIDRSTETKRRLHHLNQIAVTEKLYLSAIKHFKN